MNTNHDHTTGHAQAPAAQRGSEAIASLLTSLGTLVLGGVLVLNLATSLAAPTLF